MNRSSDISAELLAIATHELEAVVAKGQQIELLLGPLEAYVLLGCIQLACRHPENNGQASEIGEHIGRRIQQALAPEPGPLAEVLELSWNKQCRACGCTNETPCIDATGEPCHWAGPSLCSRCAEPLIVTPGGTW